MAELPHNSEILRFAFQDGDNENRSVTLKSPGIVIRNGGYMHRTVIKNLGEHPVGVELVAGHGAEMVVDAGKDLEKRENGTVIKFVGGTENRVTVWNPKRFPITVDWDDLIETDGVVEIYIRKNKFRTKEQTEAYYRRKKLKTSGSESADKIKIEVYEKENPLENI